MFVDYANAGSASIFNTIFYALTSLGHQAVIVFFVLSGFFVGGSVLRNRNQFHWEHYAIARLTRLWTVLIPALVMTLAIDQVIASLTPEALQPEFQVAHGFGNNIYSGDLATFLGNLLFVQTILTPVFGTNGPLWSLSNEFWYYILFPLCVAAFGKMPNVTLGAWPRQLAMGLMSGGILTLLPHDMRLGYLVWLMGIFVYMSVGKLFIKKLHKGMILLMLVASVGVFAGALVYSKSTFLQQQLALPSDIVLGLGFALLCIMITQYRAPLFLSGISRVISEFSYSLYLSHFPFVILIAAEFRKGGRQVPDAVGALQFFGWLMLLLIIAWLFWKVFESKTHLVRGVVYRKLIPHQIVRKMEPNSVQK